MEKSPCRKPTVITSGFVCPTQKKPYTLANWLYTKGLWKRITQIKSFISQTLRMSAR